MSFQLVPKSVTLNDLAA